MKQEEFDALPVPERAYITRTLGIAKWQNIVDNKEGLEKGLYEAVPQLVGLTYDCAFCAAFGKYDSMEEASNCENCPLSGLDVSTGMNTCCSGLYGKYAHEKDIDTAREIAKAILERIKSIPVSVIEDALNVMETRARVQIIS